MKRFAAAFLAVLAASEAFAALGGSALFDFAAHPYGTAAVWALVIAIVAHALITQQ